MCRVNLHTRATKTTLPHVVTCTTNCLFNLPNFAKHCREYLSHCFMCASSHITNHIFNSTDQIRHQRPHTMRNGHHQQRSCTTTPRDRDISIHGHHWIPTRICSEPAYEHHYHHLKENENENEDENENEGITIQSHQLTRTIVTYVPPEQYHIEQLHTSHRHYGS